MPSTADRPSVPRGLLDTNILIHGSRIDPAVLPDAAAISAVTIAELAAGVHTASDDRERARRVDLLQRAESAFAPLPFDVAAARAYGRIVAAVRAEGRTARSRVADLMIAAIAVAHGLPLFTTNPDDFAGLHDLADIVPVAPPES